ncbi:hypothetical protein ACI2UK_24380 [Ralstonia nicotianae]|uniref:hypothetical protein n=1 Tax=Ralstonia pseudosolanacearum TaxID=1310165 RepID=UPI002004BC1A|nr:hypothetical protein [Ralstonia pseudosolanacearum]MCK4120420.1 hypothetical protein [Ralstonia pseudosolanacearum]
MRDIVSLGRRPVFTHRTPTIKISPSFTRSRRVTNTAAGAPLERDASRLLRRGANDLVLRERDYSNRAGNQRQTDDFALHTDALHFDISPALADPAASVRYRTCAWHGGFGGGRGNFVSGRYVHSGHGTYPVWLIVDPMLMAQVAADRAKARRTLRHSRTSR